MPFDSRASFIDVNGISEQEYSSRRETLNRICAVNKELPHCSIDEFRHMRGIYSTEDFDQTPTVLVPTKNIVASSSLVDWADVNDFDTPQSFDRIWRVYESMPKIGFDKNEPLFLTDYGGLLVVNCGQRRTMIAKALGVDQVYARVRTMYPTEIHIPNESMFDELSSQQSQGLWTGSMICELDSDGRYKNGKSSIMSYRGLWQFCQHPQLMEQIYHQIGASGQAELFI